MAFRAKMSRKNSKKSFTRGASRTHKRNLQGSAPRGGYRL